METDREEIFEPRDLQLSLKCAACGHVARYKVGQVFVGSGIKDGPDRMMDHIAFAGYFRCRKCKSAWPWELTRDSTLTLTVLMFGKTVVEDDERIVFATPVLFDGSTAKSAAQAEEHLLGILEREPDNSFVWDRLGNIYLKAGLVPKAAKAFKKAIETNPENIDAYYSLGHISFEKGNYKQAEEHLHKVILLGRKGIDIPDEMLRGFVGHALEMLAEMNIRTDGVVSVFPAFEHEGEREPGEPAVVYLTEFDLSEESEWERLTDVVLGRRKGADMLRSKPQGKAIKVGRNAPCPCGSGKKFKRCCGS